MIKTIYIEYAEAGVPTNAHSVVLASEDGSFGIKRLDTGEVIVANNTEVTNSTIGVYQYDLDYEDGIIYVASWKVVPSAGNTPQYVQQNIGPFTTTSLDIRAVAENIGSARQGTMVTLKAYITNFDGLARDAEDISITVTRDHDGSIATSDIPYKVTTGFYVHDWCIPDAQAIGTYTVTWKYTVDGVIRSLVQTMTIAADTTMTLLYSGVPLDMRMRLEHLITYAQRIPVRKEQASVSPDLTTYRFTFPNWNQTAGCKIYRNNKIVTSGVAINYFKGEVVFDEAQMESDAIIADYNFRWFTEEQLNSFLYNAVQTFNSFPPHSNYSLTQIGMYHTKYVPAILGRAATDAIRQMMMSLSFQEPEKVFGGAEAADRKFQRLDTLKKNYEEEWKLIFENKKYGRYPGIRVVSTPEFTMPGGRSRWFRDLFSTSGS